MGHLGRSAFFSLKLKRLNLKNNPFIHDEALAVFANCNSLNTLNLDNTDVTEMAALRLQGNLAIDTRKYHHWSTFTCN